MSTPPCTLYGPNADVILRAPPQPGSDEFEDFHVHKIILSIASAIFQDTFSIPQPPSHTPENTTLDIVQVEETARVLEPFLQLIYPVEPPVLEDLRLVDDLFRLADKYMANGVHAKLVKNLDLPSLLKKNPIGVYAVACRNNLGKEAEVAISHTFTIPNVVSNISEDDLQVMAVKDYHRLLTEHTKRRDRLVDAVSAVKHPREGSTVCKCDKMVRKGIYLELSRRPFLDRETLEEYLSSTPRPSCKSGMNCILQRGAHSEFLADIIRKTQQIQGQRSGACSHREPRATHTPVRRECSIFCTRNQTFCTITAAINIGCCTRYFLTRREHDKFETGLCNSKPDLDTGIERALDFCRRPPVNLLFIMKRSRVTLSVV